MKYVWKRTMCLLLSGVLLLSNIPVQALATEFFEEETVEEITVEPLDVQPVEKELEAEEDVANELAVLSEAKLYPVWIDGEQLTDLTVTDACSYEESTKTLTLNGAQLNSVQAEEDLTIKLAENTESEIEACLCSDANITIQGKGRLLAGSIAAAENLEIKDAVVKVGTDIEEEEAQKTLIQVNNAITLNGAAHLATAVGHNAVVFADAEGGKLAGEGYYRTNGAFVETAAETALESADYFEYIGKGHLAAEYTKTAEEHYKTCADENCPLYNVTKLDQAAHTLKYASEGMTITAECDVCRAVKTFTLNVSDSEWGAAATHEVTEAGILNIAKPAITYRRDGADVTDITEIGAYTAVMTLGGETVTADFSVTKVDFSKATVTVNEAYDYDGQPKEPAAENLTVVLNGKTLENAAYRVEGYSNNTNAGEAAVTVAPVDADHYTGTAGGKFTIAPKTILSGDVKLSAETLTYNGEAQAPEVVKADGNSDVDFVVEEHEPTVNAGTYTLKIKGQNNYQGSVDLTYKIVAAEAVLAPMEPQNIAAGSGAFAEPVYKVGDKEVEGTFFYTFEDIADAKYDEAKAKLAAMNDGAEVTVNFTFVPAVADNIANPEGLAGSFMVKLNKVRFGINNAAITDQNVVAADLTYGVAEPVSTAVIEAYVGDQKAQQQGQYTVTYTDANTNAVAVERPLNAGKYNFTIAYTGTVDGVYCRDYLVYTGAQPIEITKKQIVITNKHTVQHLTHKNGNEQPLLSGEVKADVTAEGAFEWTYQVNNTAPVTVVPAKEAVGVYEIVYYAKSNSGNYLDSEKVTEKIAILPVLEATYGEYLKDIDLTGTGFSWDEQENPKDTTPVGNVMDPAEKRTFILESPKLSKISAVVTVLPKELTPVVEVNKKYKDGYIPYDERLVTTNIVVKDGDKTLTYKTDYNVSPKTDNSVPSITYTVTDVAGGNYVIKETKITVKLYRAKHVALAESNFPKEDLEEATNSTLEEVKTALADEVKDANYPVSAMKYFNIYLTRVENNKWVELRDEGAFPASGIDYVIPYADLGATKDDSFKVSVMDTFGDDAGEEAEVITSAKTDKGLQIHLDQYAVVCVAKEMDPNSTFKVTTTSSSYGTVKFTVGKETAEKTSAEVKVGETITITVTPKTNYAVTKVQYLYKDGTTTKVATIEQDDDGEYTLKMPAKNIQIKATFAKKTSSSKNPYSGDTSNIYLWVTILAASGATIGALMAFWFKKRKK